eukprot:SAG31_NODE_272_length_18690_cov_14.520785_22_plen_135_part_00
MPGAAPPLPSCARPKRRQAAQDRTVQFRASMSPHVAGTVHIGSARSRQTPRSGPASRGTRGSRTHICGSVGKPRGVQGLGQHGRGIRADSLLQRGERIRLALPACLCRRDLRGGPSHSVRVVWTGNREMGTLRN